VPTLEPRLAVDGRVLLLVGGDVAGAGVAAARMGATFGAVPAVLF
jgi:hypothetical protein